LTGGNAIKAIVPTSFEGAYRLAQVVVAAGMAPKSVNTVEKCAVAILHGLEVGLTPMAALQSIAVINGFPTIWGDGMLGLIRGSGLLEDISETIEVDDKGEVQSATCTMKRKGQPTPIVRMFTRPMAARAGLLKKEGPWQTYPDRMMAMRARAWCGRDGFADVLKGLGVREEIDDMVAVAGTATFTPPPEPRRSDFAEPTPSDDEAPDHDPDTGEVTERPWQIPASVVGQDARRKIIMDQVQELARVKVDIDEIQAEHQEFIDKLGRAKAEMMRALDARRAELPERLEVEA
jgi:hypothetical protein